MVSPLEQLALSLYFSLVYFCFALFIVPSTVYLVFNASAYLVLRSSFRLYQFCPVTQQEVSFLILKQ